MWLLIFPYFLYSLSLTVLLILQGWDEEQGRRKETKVSASTICSFPLATMAAIMPSVPSRGPLEACHADPCSAKFTSVLIWPLKSCLRWATPQPLSVEVFLSWQEALLGPIEINKTRPPSQPVWACGRPTHLCHTRARRTSWNPTAFRIL